MLERRRDGCRTEAERSAYAEGLSDAAQRVRYYLKHQNFDYNPTSFEQGFEVACDGLNDLITEMAYEAEKAPLRTDG